jgi:hypothetical protein
MAQIALNYIAKNPSNVGVPLETDAAGNLMMTSSATSSALDLTVATVIKATPGRLVRVSVISGGTVSNGAFTFNDCATTGAAATANEIATIPSGATAGTMVMLDWPCMLGIVLSAVPTAGSPIISVSFV